MSFLPFFPSHLESLGVEGMGRVATWAGLIYGAAPLAAACMSPIWGALGDRFGRRLMVLRSMFAIALFVGGMAFATSPLQLLLLRIGQGLFSGFVAPSLTLVSVAAPLSVQGRVQASLQTAMTIGGIAGPALGEALRRLVGLREAYLCVSALALSAAALIAALAKEEAAHRRSPGGGTLAPGSSEGELRRHRRAAHQPRRAHGGRAPVLDPVRTGCDQPAARDLRARASSPARSDGPELGRALVQRHGRGQPRHAAYVGGDWVTCAAPSACSSAAPS